MIDNTVDQTIQWARESLQRRRSELHQKKKEEQQQEARNSLSGREEIGSNDVNSILERGRELLRQAESHSQALGQYTSRTTTENKDNDNNGANFRTLFLQNAGEKEAFHNTNRFSNIPVDRPSWGHRFDLSVDDNDDNSIAAGPNLNQCTQQQNSTVNEKSSDLKELLKEGEARVRLDNLIATIRRQGEDPLAAEMQHNPTTTSASFDPTKLRAAKRAALKKTKFDEALAESEMQSRLMSNFKALPLPGGVEVKNDIFAPTKAFQGKHAGIEFIRSNGDINDFSSSQSLGGFESLVDRMSVATSRTSIDMNTSFANEQDKERANQLRQAKKAKKKKLLDSVNRKLAQEIGESLDDDVSIAYSVRSTQSHVDYLEDPSKLRHQIARLEAKLKVKKSQRSAILNDIVDVDLNAIFERLLSQDADENARNIVDRIKRKVCGNVLLVDDFQQLPRLKEHHPWNDEEKETDRGVLYDRQESWIRQREKKLLEARLRIEAEEMSDITGKPRLNHANDSWKKAKDAHDEALKRIAEEQDRRQKEKEERERIEYEIKMKEAKDLEMETKAQMKSVRSEVTKEEQIKRLEKLSQPRQIRVAPMPSLKKEDVGSPVNSSKLVHDLNPNKAPKVSADTPYEVSNTHKKTPKATPAATNEYVEFSGKKFSEMDDKEFAKIVKRISKMAKQKVKDAHAAAASESCALGCTDDSQPSSPKFTIIGNPENLQPIEFATGHFLGSAAQAKFLQQLSNNHS
jgi:hypothetical protein